MGQNAMEVKEPYPHYEFSNFEELPCRNNSKYNFFESIPEKVDNGVDSLELVTCNFCRMSRKISFLVQEGFPIVDKFKRFLDNLYFLTSIDTTSSSTLFVTFLT